MIRLCCIIWRGFYPPPPPHLSTTPHLQRTSIILLLVTHPFLEFCEPPSPNFAASRPSSNCIQLQYITLICIKPCYDHPMNTTEEWWF